VISAMFLCFAFLASLRYFLGCRSSPASHLRRLLATPAQDLVALGALLRDLDAKVRSLRDAAEIGH
jgi:hypothetical protein